jgi:hypothetical protein
VGSGWLSSPLGWPRGRSAPPADLSQICFIENFAVGKPLNFWYRDWGFYPQNWNLRQIHADGFLDLHEVYTLDLARADLVVLSACQTQLGAHSGGDDIIGLNRAFIYAGAPSVIASLWSVNDEATSLLMTAFHTHLKQGMGKARALKAAQAETRTKYAHPYYWAAFVLTGDAGTATSSQPNSSPWAIGVIIVLGGQYCGVWWELKPMTIARFNAILQRYATALMALEQGAPNPSGEHILEVLTARDAIQAALTANATDPINGLMTVIELDRRLTQQAGICRKFQFWG